MIDGFFGRDNWLKNFIACNCYLSGSKYYLYEIDISYNIILYFVKDDAPK